jgi:hypothetical protein
MEGRKRKGFASGLSSRELRWCGDWCGVVRSGAEEKNWRREASLRPI